MPRRRGRLRPARSRTGLFVVLFMVIASLVGCVVAVALLSRDKSELSSREVILSVAYSPEKQELFETLADGFNRTKPRLPKGKRVKLVAAALSPDEMVEVAADNVYQAISPDSSIWLAEIDRRWNEEQATDTGLVGETTRYMVSPVIIAMWEDVARSLGYPEKELGWQDLLRAADQDPSFKWSHPSTSSASGLLATLAEFYAGAGITRGLTEELATAPATLDYVSRLEKTVKHYGEGEQAVIAEIERKGRAYLDAFVVQEQILVQYNMTHDEKLVAIYPFEGAMWEDHPLALLEHPLRTDEERLAYGLLKDFLLSQETQMLVLRHGYRPTDLSIGLDHADSPITLANGADPAKPYTSLQIPSPSVISVVKNVWWYTKRHTNIYLVADVSGSMDGRKLRDAQGALRTFIDQIQGDSERVGLITFAGLPREAVPLTQLGEGRPRLMQAIDGLTAGGGTALVDAVGLALAKLHNLEDSERINAIVVMTDGKENRSRDSIYELIETIEEVAESEVPVVIFCIAYGRDADFRTLESISDASGGFTRRGELETIEELYKTLSTYF